MFVVFLFERIQLGTCLSHSNPAFSHVSVVLLHPNGGNADKWLDYIACPCVVRGVRSSVAYADLIRVKLQVLRVHTELL